MIIISDCGNVAFKELYSKVISSLQIVIAATNNTPIKFDLEVALAGGNFTFILNHSEMMPRMRIDPYKQ